MVMVVDFVIVEVEEIVEVGEIVFEYVYMLGLFVDYLV